MGGFHESSITMLVDAQTAGFRRGLQMAQRDLGQFRREHERTAAAARMQAIEERNLNRALAEQSRRLGVLTLQYVSLRRAMLTLGVRTAVTGFASMTASVSALVNGLVMLTSTAAGAGAALGVVGASGLTALAQGAVVASLALNDVGKALTTTGKQHELALAKLTKPARAFVHELAGMRDGLREIKLLAQAGLFEGLARAAKKAAPLLDPLKQVTYDTARAIGYLGERITDVAVARKDDLKRLGERNVITLRRFGDAAINVGEALIDVFRAADPFIGHVTAGIVTFSKTIQDAAAKARGNGGLASFFYELRRSWDEWTSIIGKFGSVVFNVLKAASGPAHTMNAAIGDTLEKWKQWTGSDAGQRRMIRFFESSLKPLGAMANLIGHIFTAWVGLTDTGNKNAASFFNFLSDKVVPLFEDLGKQLNQDFFPSFLRFIGAITDYLRALIPALAPVGRIVQHLNALLEVAIGGVTALLNALPDVNKLTVGLVLGSAVYVSWRRLRTEIGGVTAEALRYVGASRLAGAVDHRRGQSSGMPSSAPVVAVGGSRARQSSAVHVPYVGRSPVRYSPAQLNRYLGTVRDGGAVSGVRTVVPTLSAARTAYRTPAALQRYQRQLQADVVKPPKGMASVANIAGNITAATAQGVSAGMQKARPVMRGAFAFAAINGVIGGLSSQSKNIGDKLQDALSAATFGVVPTTEQARSERQTKNAARIQQNIPKLRDIADANAGLKFIQTLKKIGDLSDEDARKLTAMVTQVRSKMESVGQASAKFKDYWKLPDLGATTKANVVTPIDSVLLAFKNMESTAGESMDKIKSSVTTSMATIRGVLGKDTDSGRAAVARNFRLAAKAVRESMEAGKISTKEGTAAIRSYLISSLTELNPSWGRQEAGRFLHGRDPQSNRPMNSTNPHAGHARGAVYNLPGMTQGDRVPLSITAAPGEDVAILNRHQRKVADRRFADMGGFAGLFRNVTTPHHHSAGFASGGIVRGRVSAFGPPLEGADSTASGLSSSQPGLALNIAPGTDAGWNNSTTDAWVRARQMFKVTIQGHSANLPVIDKGPAGFTQRAIDVTGAGARILGFDPAAFPTDAQGIAEMVNGAMSAAASVTGSSGAKVKGVKTSLKGLIGSLTQAGLDKARDAAQQTLDRAAQQFAPMDIGGGGGSVSNAGVSGAGLPSGVTTPDTRWNPAHKPIAKWIVPILQWASMHGWGGTVTSGFRTHAEQAIAAGNYGLQHYPGGNPFGSNHLTGNYPGGAVDVTAYEQLAGVLRGYTGSPNLMWAGPTIGDYVHFSSNGHARGALFASGGLPPRDNGYPDVNSKDAVTSQGKSKSKKKASTKKPFAGGPARPDLSKVRGKLSKKKSSVAVPAWLKDMQTAEDAFAGFADKAAPLKPYEDGIGLLQARIENMAADFDLSQEQSIVTLFDSDAHHDLSEFLATPEGQGLAKYVSDPSNDSLDVVNKSGRMVQGKWTPGIDQAVNEYLQLLALHVGIGGDGAPSVAAPTPTSLLGLMTGELGQITNRNLPWWISDRDAAASRVKQLTHVWNMRYADRTAALAQLKKLSGTGMSWEERVATNDARIDTLKDYKDKIAGAAVGHRLTDEAKRNRLWATTQIRKLGDENTDLKKDKPAAGLLPARKGETDKQRKAREAQNRKIRARQTSLRNEAVQDRLELAFISGDIHKFDPRGGLVGQWASRLDYDNTRIGDLVGLQRDLSLTNVPAEQRAVNELLQGMADAQGTSVPYKLAVGGGSDSASMVAELQKQIADDALKQLAVSESQRLVIEGITPLLNARFLGAFAHGSGGRVVGETGLALLHANEVVTPAADGPYYNRAAAQSTAGAGGGSWELHLHGDLGQYLRVMESRIEGRVVKTVTQTAGRRSRVIASAPGGRS